MARQGNYVTLPGGSGPNPFEGVSKSLADLSKSYASKSALDREEALQRDKAEEDQRRWDIANRRQQTTADRETEAYNTKQAMTNWYKNFGEDYNPDLIRTQKAKDIYGVTDEQLKGDVGRKILDAVPIYQEDVANFYGKDFLKQFGTEFDPTNVQNTYSNLNSLDALQKAEDTAAKQRFETAKFFINKRIDAAGKLDPNGTAGTVRGKTSTKIPKTYSDISVADLVNDFDVNSSWNPLKSEKQDAADMAQETLDLLQKEGVYNAAQAQAIVEFVLDRSRNEEDLKGINTDRRNMSRLIEQAKQGMTDTYDPRLGVVGRREGNEAARRYLEGALSNDLDPNAFNPRDIRAVRRQAAQQLINKLLGRKTGLGGVGPASVTATATRPTVPRPAAAPQNYNWDLAAGTIRPSATTRLKAAEKALLAQEPQVTINDNIPLPLNAPNNANAVENTNLPTIIDRLDQVLKAGTTDYPVRQPAVVPPRQRTVDPTGVVLPGLGNLAARAQAQAYNRLSPNVDRLTRVPRLPGLSDKEYQQLINTVLNKK